VKKLSILPSLAAASLLLIGCSNPQSDFVKMCISNDIGAQSECECIANRLDDALSKSDFKKLTQAMANDDFNEKAVINEVGEDVYREFIAAMKACDF